jgi:hypothetical protein
MLKWLPLLLATASCATNRGIPLDQLLERSLFKKEIVVANSDEAKLVLNNQLRFWKEIFTQSIDPYYHSPKWPNHCLESNQIGALRESAMGLTVVSRFWLNSAGEVGFCSDSYRAMEAQVIMHYCPKTSIVHVLKIPQSKSLDLSRGVECP